MNHCMVTTGFFVLGRCGRPPVATCGSCGRPACDRHVLPGGVCSECAAAQGYQDPHHPLWARGYRRAYYQRSSSTYGDTYYYSSFDDYDRGAFDPDDAYDPDYEPYDGNGYVDS